MLNWRVVKTHRIKVESGLNLHFVFATDFTIYRSNHRVMTKPMCKGTCCIVQKKKKKQDVTSKERTEIKDEVKN